MGILREVWVSVRHTLVFAAMSILFTLLITGIAQLFFNNQANGSLVSRNGQLIGSSMIGQSCPRESVAGDGSLKVTVDPRFFQGRLSYTDYTTGPPANVTPCDGSSSSGSNLGLLRIHIDAGLEGHAFLGSASNPASMDGPQLIRSLKPPV